jgi:hypothetical protein
MIAMMSAKISRMMQPTHQKRWMTPFLGGSAPVEAVQAAPESVAGEPWPYPCAPYSAGEAWP